MKPGRLAILSIAVIFACALPALAQTTEPDRVIVLQGDIRSIEWDNPNVRVHLAVLSVNGQVERWIVEGDEPRLMVQRGLAKESFRVGEAIIFCGSRRGSRTGFLLDGGGVSFVDGRTVYFGRASEGCRQANGNLSTTSSPVWPIVNSPVQPFVNSPVQPFTSAPVSGFGQPPVVIRGGFGAASDAKKPLILRGVIQDVDQTTSTIRLHVDVQDNSGRIERWVVAGDPPQAMLQSLQRGEPVIICGALPSTATGGQNNTQVLLAGGLAFADGRTIYFGQAADACRGPEVTSQDISVTPQDTSSSKGGARPPLVNSPVQPFVNPPVTPFGAPPR